MSRKIRLGIVGLRFGEDIIRHLLPPYPDHALFEIAGCCDLNTSRRDMVAHRWKLPTYDSLAAMLDDKSIEAIGLFTPPAGRASLIQTIAEAGKHIVTTKPIEFDPDKLALSLQAARERRRVVHVNSPSPRPTPDLRQIDQWREQFDMGRLVSIRGEVWASYCERADQSWYDDPIACPAAPVLRLGVYLLNDFIHFAGEPLQIRPMTERLRTGRPTADNATLQLRFANGCLGSIFASFCVEDGDSYRNTLILNFEHGTIYRNCGPYRSTYGMRESEVTLVRGTGCRRAEVHCVMFDSISGNYLWSDFYQDILSEAPISRAYEARLLESARTISRLSSAEEALT